MEKEISCQTVRILLEYVKNKCKGDCSGILANLHPDIDSIADPESYLQDSNNWVSCDVAARMFERARHIMKDEMVAYQAARHAVENVSLGYGQKIFIKAFWSIQLGIRNLQIINDKYNRNKRIEILEMKGNHAIIRLHWNPEMKVSKDFCLMFQGSSTFMPLIWGGKPLTLKETCCYFEGAPHCEYVLSWTLRNRFNEIYSRFFTSKAVLMETIREREEDKKIIEQKYEEVNRLNVDLSRKIRQLSAIQETGKAILSVLDLGQLLEVIMNLLCDVCNLDRAIIMLVNEGKGVLEYIHGVGLRSDDPEKIKGYSVPLNRLSNIMARVANTGKSEYVPDVQHSELRKGNVILSSEKPSSVYVVPLITKSKVIGVIGTDGIAGTGVPEDTREALETFAPQIAIAIENARLYRKLQDQMEELKRSRVLLSRAEKLSLLGNLAARLAHEIKNPMTAIATFMQLLPNKFDDEEFRSKFYMVVREETHRVNNLITELLDLVKKRESHFEFGDLHGLIEKVIFLMSPQSKAKKIAVETCFDPRVETIWMDEAKMKEVILNILSNAVDFTPQNGRIEIRTNLFQAGKERPKIQLTIKDSGPGIPESNVEKIFDPYFTTKHKSSIHQGTGLGLFIAHQNMQDHGGNIEVRSKLNGGTTFILTLPCITRSIFGADAAHGD